MRKITIYLLWTLLTINIISCDKKADEGQKINQLYITEKGDSIETGFWSLEAGPSGVNCSGNFSDGFRTDKWTYSNGHDTTIFTWTILAKDSLKINLPDYLILTDEESPTVFHGKIKGKDENCYLVLLKYDLDKIKASVYDYLYQAVEHMENSKFETLESREIKKYSFKNIEIFKANLVLKGTRKYQVISYIFVVDNILYDLTYRDFSEDVDYINQEIFNDIMYSFETSDKDLFGFNNKHYLKEENVNVETPKQN